MGVTNVQRKDGLREYRVQLIDYLDILDSGLLDEMQQKNILNKRQAAAIRGRGEGTKDQFQANGRLIDDILDKCDLHKYNAFLVLLQKYQEDLAKLLQGQVIKISDTVQPLPQVTETSQQKYAELRKRAEADPDLMYQMNRNPRGKALIINVRESREGTDVDRDNLQKLWGDFMHFTVTTYNDEDDLTAAGIKSNVKAFSSDPDLKESQAIVVCILSHGKEECIFGTDGKGVSLQELYSLFSNKNTNIRPNVPRLFFIQACRKSEDRADDQTGDEDEDAGGITVPDSIKETLTDFFWGYATPAGSLAYRHTEYGSRYISALVQTFYKYAHERDISAMHNLVNKAVSENISGGFNTISECKLNFTKSYLYFFP